MTSVNIFKKLDTGFKYTKAIAAGYEAFQESLKQQGVIENEQPNTTTQEQADS